MGFLLGMLILIPSGIIGAALAISASLRSSLSLLTELTYLPQLGPRITEAADLVIREVVIDGLGNTTPDQVYLGDIYVHKMQPPKAVILILTGLSPYGKEDRETRKLARALARHGFAVLVPEIPGMREQRISSANIDHAKAAIIFASRRMSAFTVDLATPMSSPLPLAIVAVSYMVGPAILALQDPELAEKPGLLLAIGGYYDLEETAVYMITGMARATGTKEWHRRESNALARWYFVLSNLDRLEDIKDQVRLHAMAVRRMQNPDTAIDDLSQGLSPQGQSLYAFISATDPEEVFALAQALPDRIRSEMQALTLKGRSLLPFPFPVLLIHGRDDPVIPASQSEDLLRALPGANARLYLLDNLFHAEITPALLGDAWDILGITWALFRWQNEAAE